MAFALLSNDLVIHVFLNLEDDPRDWARLACVSSRFCSIVRNVCYRSKCCKLVPSIALDLTVSSDAPPGGWVSLYKISVCCPGLLHSGILLENSDFGLERDIGPDENYRRVRSRCLPLPPPPAVECAWSLYDDLYDDTVYAPSEPLALPILGVADGSHLPQKAAGGGPAAGHLGGGDGQKRSAYAPFEHLSSLIPAIADDLGLSKKTVNGGPGQMMAHLVDGTRAPSRDQGHKRTIPAILDDPGLRKKAKCGPAASHLAGGGAWALSREQGHKLLATRFRSDCLYICNWPGCVHEEEKRKYMLFRGIFKDFKRSSVWRSITDGNRSRIAVGCAFCSCSETWDLYSAFCLRRVFGFHEDGQPEVRAFVCENGHVSGAWTERPMYS